TQMSVGSATQVSLTPTTGGLVLDVELDRVAIGMHLRYAVACFDGSRDISLAASHIQVRGTLTVGVNAPRGAFDIALESPVVKVTGFDADVGGVPGEIVDLLHLDAAIGSVIGWATGVFVVPLVNSALDELRAAATVSVLGTPVD